MIQTPFDTNLCPDTSAPSASTKVRPCHAPPSSPPHRTPADYYATHYLPAQSSSNIRYARCTSSSPSHQPAQLDREPPALPHVRPRRGCRTRIRRRVFVSPVHACLHPLSSRASHHLEAAGAVLYTFSIFMLSLARPGAYYQVRVPLRVPPSRDVARKAFH